MSPFTNTPCPHCGGSGKTIDLPAPSMPTITIKMHEWKKGWRNRPYQRSANTAYMVVQGHGESTIGDKTFTWEFGDTIAAPAWNRIEHRASADAVIVSTSDEELMHWTKYYRIQSMD